MHLTFLSQVESFVPKVESIVQLVQSQQEFLPSPLSSMKFDFQALCFNFQAPSVFIWIHTQCSSFHWITSFDYQYSCRKDHWVYSSQSQDSLRRLEAIEFHDCGSQQSYWDAFSSIQGLTFCFLVRHSHLLFVVEWFVSRSRLFSLWSKLFVPKWFHHPSLQYFYW